MKIKRIVLCAVAFCLCFGAYAEYSTNSSFKVLLHKKRGTFRIVSVDSVGNTKNVLSGYDEGITSFFALKIGGSAYKLQNTSVAGDYTDFGGGELVYTIARKAKVHVNFFPISSNSDDKYDVIKVTATVTNNGDKAENFAFKAVFDTLLGEQIGKHFSTAQINSVNSEMQFAKMDEVRFISSSDGTDTINFLVYGNDITEPEYVTLGIKDMLVDGGAWVPTVAKARLFDSRVTYNNSAVCINWEEKTISPGESYDITFYMSVAADGEAAVTTYGDAAEPEQKEIIPVADIDEPRYPDVDMEYVQAILDRISEISMDGSNTSNEELLRLNAELDAILEQLR